MPFARLRRRLKIFSKKVAIAKKVWYTKRAKQTSYFKVRVYFLEKYTLFLRMLFFARYIKDFVKNANLICGVCFIRTM